MIVSPAVAPVKVKVVSAASVLLLIFATVQSIEVLDIVVTLRLILLNGIAGMFDSGTVPLTSGATPFVAPF